MKSLFSSKEKPAELERQYSISDHIDPQSELEKENCDLQEQNLQNLPGELDDHQYYYDIFPERSLQKHHSAHDKIVEPDTRWVITYINFLIRIKQNDPFEN